MYYANISYIKDKLRHYMFKGVLTAERSESGPDLEAAEAAPHWPFPEKGNTNEAAPGDPPVRYIILDMTPVSGGQSANVEAGKDCLGEELNKFKWFGSAEVEVAPGLCKGG
jgi:hypothetical protein